MRAHEPATNARIDVTRLAPQTGTAFRLAAGRTLRVVDPTGEQVADLIAFSDESRQAWLSAGRTFDYNESIYLTTGHVLYSNRSQPMLTIVADTVGRHDFLYTRVAPRRSRCCMARPGIIRVVWRT
jgi:uncharacterized protein